MPRKHSINVYLNEQQIKVVRLALDAYYDSFGELISDYKQNEALGMTPTEAERIDYLDSLNIRDHIRILLDKIR